MKTTTLIPVIKTAFILFTGYSFIIAFLNIIL